MKVMSVVVAASLLVATGDQLSFALNEPSHELVNEQATRGSQLDQTLSQELSLGNGIEQTIKGKPVIQWVREGGVREDAGSNWDLVTGKARPFRHFHDPLLPWDRSGLYFPLTIPPRFTRYESSIRWAQRTNQDSETSLGNFSWLDARRYYLTALTDPDQSAREQGFANTFRALGQIMHLIGDASVPEHVRNDPHPMGALLNNVGQVGNYEYWVLAQHRESGAAPRFTQDYLSTSVTLDPDLLKIPIPASESIARAPIARLFDSDRYTGANPDVTAESRIGIAEITNANFVSEHTGAGEYPHPAIANTEKYIGVYSKNGEKRAYYLKKGMGVPGGAGLHVDPVGTECALDELTGFVTLCLDNDVWQATARHMLPRAARYSQELLDHFFRGKLEPAVVPGAAGLTLQVTNRSEEPVGPGTLTVYSEDNSGNRTNLGAVDVPTAVAPQAPLPELAFAPPVEDPAQFISVFSGTLGQEPGAVIGKVVDTGGLEELAGSYIRTQDTVYSLPLAALLPNHSIYSVKWGEQDTTVVVYSKDSSKEESDPSCVAFSAFEFSRQPGSRAIVTRPGEFDQGMPVVDLRWKQTVTLSALLDRSLGSFTLTQTEHLPIYRLTYTHTETLVWNKTEEIFTCSGYPVCDPESVNVSAGPGDDYRETYRFAFPFVLDRQHWAGQCWEGEVYVCSAYTWDWSDFTLTAKGDILLWLSLSPVHYWPDTARSVPLKTREADGTFVTEYGLGFDFGRPMLTDDQGEPFVGLDFYAWFNLSQRTVVAKTMADQVTIDQEVEDYYIIVDDHHITLYEGGPADGQSDETWRSLDVTLCETQICGQIAGPTASFQGEWGIKRLDIAGLFGGGLAPLGLDQATIAAVPTPGYVMLGDKNVKVNTITYRFAQAPYLITGTINSLWSWDNPLRGEQAVAKFPIVFSRPASSRLVIWNGLQGTARSLLETPDTLYAPLTNQRWALVGANPANWQDPDRAYLVALDGSATYTLPIDRNNWNYGAGFTLVAPEALYNAFEGKYYVTDGSLTRTLLPLKPLQNGPLDLRWANWPNMPYQLARPR